MGRDEQKVTVAETSMGFGVLANCSFEEGEVIGEIKGKVHDDPDYESDYCMDLGGDAKLEPKSPFRFLNHSCEPNCELVLWKWRRRKKGKRPKYQRLWLQALRPVGGGEELTIDYAWPASAAIACRCQSRTCRGWIVHPDELHDITDEASAAPVAAMNQQALPAADR